MATVIAPRANPHDGPSKTTSDTAQTHQFTCNSCQVAFRNGDLQRIHMRTDWHRYNLKRRVASLPPISAEVFAEKVLTAQATSTAVAAKASFEKPCVDCQRTYYSQNAYENHLKSQKHRLRVSMLAKDGSLADGETGSVVSSTISLGEPINRIHIPAASKPNPSVPSIDPEAEAEFTSVVNGIRDTRIGAEPVSRRPTRPHHSSSEARVEHPLSPEKSKDESELPPAEPAVYEGEETTHECLFCQLKSHDIDTNMKHMSKVHGLFVPERQYLTDFGGLMQWLWQRIHVEPYECLYCHKTKSTVEAIQGHMRDLGHCKIAYEEEVDMIEVGQFYDFSSTYSDDDAEIHDTEMADSDNFGDGWEDADDIDSDDADEEIEIDGGTKVNMRQAVPVTHTGGNAFVIDDELHLPSGKVAGHRSLARYWRQNLRNHPSPSERFERQRLLEAAREEDLGDVQMTNGDYEERSNAEPGRGRQLISRANGGVGMIGVTDAKRREVQAVEKREVKRAQRAEKQYQWGVQKGANNQRHFRDPLLQ